MSNLYEKREEKVLSDCAAIEYWRQMRELHGVLYLFNSALLQRVIIVE
jgi:hypothetical protein